MKIGWVMGWAVPLRWFSDEVTKAFPADEHVFLEPGDAVLAELELKGPFDRIAGYSLGAHLLLAEAGRVDRLCTRITLLAPFLAFAAEDELGGRVSRTQVRYLARWVRREREKALADFYGRAGLQAEPSMAASISMETLTTGLAHLENGRAEPPVSSGWHMYVGSGDSLLDGAALKRHLPGIRIVAGATHHPRSLLQACREGGI